MNSLEKIIWTLKNPWVSLKIQLNRITCHFRPKKETLFYVGVNKGNSFDLIYRNYKHCYAFEANPELFAELQKRYKNKSNVTLINAAAAQEDGEISFQISNDTNAGSSSIGEINPQVNESKDIPILVRERITVKALNLMDFCQQHQIENITDYISDIQGMDFTVLATLTPLIEKKKIETITCEVAKNNRQIYHNIPSNFLSQFEELLNTDYNMVASGPSKLTEGKFNEVPESWWEMDCKWRVKP